MCYVRTNMPDEQYQKIRMYWLLCMVWHYCASVYHLGLLISESDIDGLSGGVCYKLEVV